MTYKNELNEFEEVAFDPEIDAVENEADEMATYEKKEPVFTKERMIIAAGGIAIGYGLNKLVRVAMGSDKKHAVDNITEDNYEKVLEKALKVQQAMKEKETKVKFKWLWMGLCKAYAHKPIHDKKNNFWRCYHEWVTCKRITYT